jgi:arylsulfatase A-like enzyme
VFVLVDDMGHNDFYSSSDLAPAWPNVARLAREQCVKVEQYYTQPICTPTRGAFMSGRMPVRLGLQHGVITGGQDYGLPLDEETLAEKLAAVGYSTVGVGKWHLGIYTNSSLPMHRGFEHWFGYMNGAEDYLTHEVQNYLDLYDDENVDRTRSGYYSAQLFGAQVVRRIHEHKVQNPEKPLFLYFPIQNVHAPLEAPSEYSESSACKDIPNADRKTFCGMAMAADEAIGNMTAALEAAFPGEDVIMVIGGDNGGMPAAGGNQCPTSASADCLRGHKAELFEGGIRNNALLCSKTLLPSGRSGTTYSKGLVHVMDWHATFRSLAGAKDKTEKPVDGVSVWDAITQDKQSPRSEFLVNIDPCSGHSTSCGGQSAAYHFQGCIPLSTELCGHWKLIDGYVTSDSWYPVPTSAPSTPSTEAEASHGVPTLNGGVSFPPSTKITYLFNISADPGEHTDLAAKFPTVVSALQAKVEALGKEALAPCNIPSGSCSADDPKQAAALKANNAWVPWVASTAAASDPSSIQV